MSGLYKSLDKSDISVTPFKVYKKYLGSDTDADAPYSFYEGVYEKDLKNLGATAPYIQESDFTTDNKLKQAVHHSVDHLFYRDFIANNKATFGSGNINQQLRILYDRVGVISIPQLKYGESVLPGSVKVIMPNTRGDRGLSSPITLIDDANGNLIISGSVYTGTPISESNQVYRLQTERGLKFLNVTHSFSFYDFQAKYNTTTKVNNIFTETSSFGFSLSLTGQPSSSIVIEPSTDEINQGFNFISQDFSIGMYIYIPSDSIVDGPILEKKSPFEIGGFNLNGEQIIYPINRYPYSLGLKAGTPEIEFSKSDGANTIQTSVQVAFDEWLYLSLSRSGSLYTLKAESTTISNSTTLSDTLVDYNCSNKSKIYIGGNTLNNSNIKFSIDQLKFWNQSLSQSNLDFLMWSSGSNSLNVGNVFYKQGMVTLTNPICLNPTGSNKPTSVEHRATVTLYETQVSCTISPGEFEFSNNPTLQVYDPRTDQFKLRSFATESSFKPYITQIGLYNDNNQLIVAGKLSQPIQVPGNVNTTFIVKFDT